jgi:PAS domain S-box-containing protein
MIDIEELGIDFFRQLADQTPAGICLVDGDGQYLFMNRALEEITGLSSGSLVNAPSLSFFPCTEREEAQGNVAVTGPSIRRRWRTRIQRPSGEQRDVDAIAIGVTVAGQQATALILFDVTDTLRLALKVSTINTFAHSLSDSGSIQELLDQLAGNLVEATGAASSIVFLLDASPPHVTLAGSSGIPDSLQQWNLARADSILAIFESGKSRLLDAHDLVQTNGLLTMLTRALNWGATIVVPLKAGDRALGAAVCAYAKGRQPDEAEATFLNTLVGLAAVAVDHARLVQLAQQQAVNEERTRLGRELHDSVSQTLYGIGLGAQSALEALNVNPDEAKESIDYVLKLATGGLTEMRTLLYKLRPESLAAEGLVEALRRHVGSIGERHKISVKLELGQEPALPLNTKHAIYRVVMEAVHNTVKHAQAASLRVLLDDQVDSLTVVIEDDGHGFDAQQEYSGHHGLDSMRERIRSLGGELTLESHLDVGTVIRATLPSESLQGVF